MTVDYRLEVPDSTTRPVVLTMQGYQTDTTLHCAITGGSKRAEVRFLSFGDGRIVNEAGNEQYKVNEILFVLERLSQSHTGKVLLTEWRAYKPDGVHRRRGRYFRQMQQHTQSSLRK